MKDQDGENVAVSLSSILDNLNVPMTMVEKDVPDSWEERSVVGEEKNYEINASINDIEETNEYWEQVKHGTSAGIVKIKQEKLENETKNRYEVLQVDENEIDINMEDMNDKEISVEVCDIGHMKDVSMLDISQISKMNTYDIAETIYRYKTTNGNYVQRKDIYDQNEQQLRVQLIQIVDKEKTVKFLEEVTEIAREFKAMDENDLEKNIVHVYNKVNKIEELSESTITEKNDIQGIKNKF